jgi:hypothetical protein
VRGGSGQEERSLFSVVVLCRWLCVSEHLQWAMSVILSNSTCILVGFYVEVSAPLLAVGDPLKY